MGNAHVTSEITGSTPQEGSERRLYEPEPAAELERLDRSKPYPGGEPPCPLCHTKVVRHVEAHPYPRGDSPFRVRLVCPNPACARWALYDW